MVIDEVASFPRARWKDLTDTVSAAVNKLRTLGLLQHANEVEDDSPFNQGVSSRKKTVREEYGL